MARGFTAFKTGPAKRPPSRYIESPSEVKYAAERFAALREAAGDEADIGIDFHGAVSPALARTPDQGAGAVPADVPPRPS
jgi:galactonate dehydratase